MRKIAFTTNQNEKKYVFVAIIMYIIIFYTQICYSNNISFVYFCVCQNGVIYH